MIDKILNVLMAAIIAISAWNLFEAHTTNVETQKAFTALVTLNKNVTEASKALAEQNALLREQLKKRR